MDNTQDQTTPDNAAEGSTQDTSDAATTMPETTEGQESQVQTQETTTSPEPIIETASAVQNKAPVVDPVTTPEATPVPVILAAPVVNPTVAPVVKTAPTVKNTEPKALEGLQTLVAEMRATGTPAQKALISSFDDYAVKMAPGQVMDHDKGAKYQYAFWKAIQNVIEHAPDGEFNKLWNVLLALAESHKDGVFGERYIMRFANAWHQSEVELASYQRIINLIKLTANAAERSKNLRNVDITRTLELTFTERGRTRIANFYS